MRSKTIRLSAWARGLALGWLGVLYLASSAAASGPWLEAERFSIPAAELLAAADAAPVPEGSPVVVLFQDTSYRFSPDGRLTQTRRWIYRILEAEALADWSTSQVRWSQWLHERPTLKARVITAGGAEHWLDENAVRDRKSPESGKKAYGNRWLLEAELPAVSVGAIVEEEIVLRGQRPAFAGGTSHRHYTALLAPTVDGRLTLEASTRLALRFGARLMPGVKPVTTVEDDQVRVVFDFNKLPPVSPPEEGAPGHRPRFPQVAFSTGRSWQKVASVLSARVEAAVRDANVDSLGSVVRGAGVMDRRARLDSILRAVRDKVSFNGLELGATPLELDVQKAFVEGSGDSLALAVTTVAALRRAGIPSHVALVRSGFGVDVEPRLPGYGLFDQALVWLEDATSEDLRWIEPTAPYARAGELTLPVQGRFALIAAPATENLILTPISEPGDNLAVEVREVQFSDYGPGKIREMCTYFGSAERTQRRITGSLDEAARRRGYQAYANAFHLASELGELRETTPTDLSRPFELLLEAVDSSRVRTDLDQAVLEVPVRELARRLPPVLLDDPRPRKEEFVFPEPFVSRWEYQVNPPDGFRIESLPKDRTIHLGPAVFQEKWRLEGDMVMGDLSFDVGQRLLAPGQFQALRSAVAGFLELPPTLLRFRLSAVETLGTQQLPDALKSLRAAADAEPGRASHRIRWSLGLLRSGLGVEARRQAQQAVALAPRWGLAHWAFGWVLLHDEVGTFFAPGMELAEARRSLEESQRLAPDEPLMSAAQARLFERDADGERYAKTAPLDLAAAAYRRATAELRDPLLHLDRLRLLVQIERWDELRAAAKLVGDRRVDVAAAGLAATDWVAAAPPWVSSGIGLREVFGGVASFQLEGPEALAGRSSALKRAVALELAVGRQYSAAASLLTGIDEALAARLHKVEPFESLVLHAQDPTTPLASLLIALRHKLPTQEQTALWLHEDVGSRQRDEMLRRLETLIPTHFEGIELSPGARVDLGLADLEVTVNGAPHLGYRVTLPAGRFFVTLRGEDLRLAAEADQPGTLGAEALRRLIAGDLPGGQQWLEWALEDVAVVASSSDPLEFSTFRALWPSTLPKNGEIPAADLRVAAAALAAPFDSGGEALAILNEALSTGGGESTQSLAIDVALLDAYAGVSDYLGLESHAEDLLQRYPSSHRAFVKFLGAKASLEKWSELEESARKNIDASMADPDARRVLAGLAVDRGALTAATDQLWAIHRETELTATDAANLLLLLLRGQNPAADEASALLARTEALGEREPRWLRSAAAWRAHEGAVHGAREALAKAVVTAGGRLQLADAYVVGRIAELCGLPETARDLYRRLAEDDGALQRAPLMRLLAQDRLMHLESNRQRND